MFKRTQWQLTLFYSTLFLMLFWLFSFGLYVWMNNSFGEGYISQVNQRQGIDTDTITKNAKVVTIAGDVALDQLLTTLLVLNGVLLVIIPMISWILAQKTLRPMWQVYEKQQQFVSDASHEMRTPLAIMSGEIEVTLKKDRTNKDYQATLLSIKEETERLSHLVENLLYLANTDDSLQSLPVELVDITDVLNDVVHRLQNKSEEKQMHVRLHTSGLSAIPLVKGNPTLLHQLFYNLLDNAITYTPVKGSVRIAFVEKRNQLGIIIRDTGIGITVLDQKKITNRFYRVDSSRSKTKGYGLGLSIVSSIIQRHGGQLTISSKVAQGSVFTVFLPTL